MQTKTSTTKTGCRRVSKSKSNNPTNARSRSGCVTCKAKHTKCDETRPECLRCTRKGVKCGGYWKEFKWSFKHQPGDTDVNHPTNGTSPSLRRESTIQYDIPYSVSPSAILDNITSDPTGPSQIDELLIEDDTPIPGDVPWANSSCTDSEDIFARSNSIVETSEPGDMTVSHIEVASAAPMELRFFEGTPLTVGLITDTSSLLISNWFEQVCTLWSGFDSEFNLNRKLALELCTSSHSVFSSLQTYFLQAATATVLSEAEEAFRNPSDMMPTGALFSLFCLGTTVCWVDARQLGLPFFRSARKILDRLNRRLGKLSAKDLELLSFFNNSLMYSEMLLAAVNQDDESLDTEDLVIGPQRDNSMQLAERYTDNSPHPWTGISPIASQLFAQAIRLCRSFRRNLKLPKETGRDFQRALEEIQEAQRLEERILGLDFQSSLCVASTGDYRTPPQHLAQVAEAYKLAALLQLYQTFPDLVALRLPSNSVHANSRHIPWEEWIIPLSLRLVSVLEHIPPNSGTRVIQPLLYITASTGLRYDSTVLLDIPGSFLGTSMPSGFPPDLFTSMGALGTPPSPAAVISRMSLDISNARHFITGRLNMLENSLPPKPVVMAKELIKAIWEAYDNEPPGSALVHWVDVMEDKNLRSMFG
ncbi:Arginine metabolism regulation II [Fusarium heterosporum]|uniref:Arginine metabolism regulation II n=1 Tax=Fusarium heterosporum TaxID=42747 RepID=A0A8H5T9K6_FUSHE|nr:Arginine metabolism regulation II [Fusarium heterosporum]